MARPKGKGHRVAITLSPKTNELFDRYAKLSGSPKATLINEYIELVVPVLKDILEVMQSPKPITRPNARKGASGIAAEILCK